MSLKAFASATQRRGVLAAAFAGVAALTLTSTSSSLQTAALANVEATSQLALQTGQPYIRPSVLSSLPAMTEKVYTAADGLIGLDNASFLRLVETNKAAYTAKKAKESAPPPPPPSPDSLAVPANDLLSVQDYIPAAAPNPNRPSRWAQWEQTYTPEASTPDTQTCTFAPYKGRPLSDWRENRELRRVMTELTQVRQSGLTVKEQRFQRDCLNNVPVPATMQRYDDAVTSAILADTDLIYTMAERFLEWEALPAHADETTRVGYFTRRQVDLQFVSDQLRSHYGLEPIPVMLVPLPPPSRLLGQHWSSAYFYDNKPLILLNSNDQFNVIAEPHKALHVLIEEVRHSIDNDLATMLTNRVLGPDDPRTLHAGLVRLNQAGSNSKAIFNPDSGFFIGRTFYDYENQYLERNAKIFSCHLADRLSGVLATRVAALKAENTVYQNTVSAQIPALRHTPAAPLIG